LRASRAWKRAPSSGWPRLVRFFQAWQRCAPRAAFLDTYRPIHDWTAIWNSSSTGRRRDRIGMLLHHRTQLRWQDALGYYPFPRHASAQADDLHHLLRQYSSGDCLQDVMQ
jgi:hypothetical protein